jgi:hypothetical protein
MIVERWAFQIKPGRVDEAVALLVAGREESPLKEHIRISTIMLGGKSDRVDWRCMFENLAQREQFWSEWVASPRNKLFLEKWLPLIDPGSEHDLWDLKSA